MSQQNAKKEDRAGRNLAAWSMLAGLLLFGTLAGPFFAGHIYTADDLGQFHLPVRAFYAEQLADGQPYDWMPQLFSGFYLTGEGQGGAYHPLHQLLYRVFPLRAALGLEYLLPYPMMMLGMWLLLRRRLGRSDAAMFGGLLFTFSSFNLLHFVHPNAIAVIAHVPWLLWAIDVVLTDSGRRRVALASVLIALLTGSQLLLGYPQFVWYSLVAECSYAIYVLTAYRHLSRVGCNLDAACKDCIGCSTSTWPRVVIAKGIGLLIGAVQLLPSLDAWLHSARVSADVNFPFWGSLHPSNLMQLVAPYVLVDRVIGGNTHEFGMYVGAVGLMLIAWQTPKRHAWGSERLLIWAVASFGIVSLLLAFGEYGPLYRATTWLPILKIFRFPSRYLVLFQLAAATLAAVGFSLLARETIVARQRRILEIEKRGQVQFAGTAQRVLRTNWTFPLFFRNHLSPTALFREYEPLWCLVGISLAVAVVALVLRRSPYTDSAAAILAGPILLTLATALIIAASRGYAAALVGLVLLAACDLGFYGMSYAVYRGDYTLEQYIASADAPPGDPEGRVVASLLKVDQPGLRTGDLMTLRGWQRADGYAGLEPLQRLDYRCLPALQVAGVRWVKRTRSTTEITGLTPHGDRWLEVPDPLPRVRLLTQTHTTSDPAEDIVRICPETTALCEVPLGLPASEPGSAKLTTEQPGRMEIDVDAPAPQLLVVAESFHPGWRAEVDGRPSRLYRVNGDFMGCIVGPGQQRVGLCFQPSSLHTGRLTSCLGLAMLTVCFIGLVFSKKPYAEKDDHS